MPDEAAAASHYNTALRTRATTAAAEAVTAFAAVKASDIDGTFAGAVTPILAAVVKGQLFGAATALAYHLGLLSGNGLAASGPPIRAAGFAEGTQTAEGLDLRAVIALAPIYTKRQIGLGVPPAQALDSGRAFLASVAQSEAQDAARGVIDVALNTETAYSGYVRVPNPGACGRCLILAGREYRTDADFARHPRCHCSARPLLRGGDRVTPEGPRDLFDRLSPAAQDQAFGKPAADAIRAGADPAQAENAKRGMRAAGDTFTTTGTRRRKGQRLSPLGCRRLAEGDAALYRSLLKRNGYIVG